MCKCRKCDCPKPESMSPQFDGLCFRCWMCDGDESQPEVDDLDRHVEPAPQD
jgi:hypothetical protein